jgi:hypothetical protein
MAINLMAPLSDKKVVKLAETLSKKLDKKVSEKESKKKA